MLILRNLVKKYKNKEVLNIEDACFDKGLYGLLGPNGAGKSTMMKLIADIIKPTSGEIEYNGLDSATSEYRAHIGFLPQKFGLYNYYSVREILEYFAVLRGVNKSDISSRIEIVLKQVNLEDRINCKIGKLSGGMKQRLGIAITMIADPDILIFDEPTVGLDPEERIRFRNLLNTIKKDKIILLSSHILSDMEDVADNLWILKDGKIVEQTDLSDEHYSYKEIEEIYMNLEGTHV